MIARHLDPRPQLSINTPYTTERSAPIETPIPSQTRRYTSTSSQTSETKESKMSNQPNHPALLIPGPIEFDDAVLQSMSHYRYVQDLILESSGLRVCLETVFVEILWTMTDYSMTVRVTSAHHSSPLLGKPFRCCGSFSKRPILHRSLS